MVGGVEMSHYDWAKGVGFRPLLEVMQNQIQRLTIYEKTPRNPR